MCAGEEGAASVCGRERGLRVCAGDVRVGCECVRERKGLRVCAGEEVGAEQSKAKSKQSKG